MWVLGLSTVSGRVRYSYEDFQEREWDAGPED